MISRSKFAFTLVEVLLVVTLVGILLALISPTFSGIRSKSLDIRLLSNLRSHAQVFAQYGNDAKGCFPYLSDPVSTFSVLRCEAQGVAEEVRFLDVSDHWQIALADTYYEGNPFAPAFGHRESSLPIGLKGWVIYPYSFISRPEYWDLATREPVGRQFAATRQDEVVFPSLKSLLLAEAAYPSLSRKGRVAPQPAALADGRADIFVTAKWEPPGPAESGTQGVYSWRPPGFPEASLFYTTRGVRGRDVK